MLDPRTVMVCIPTYNGEIKAELAGMLVANSRLFAGISFTVGVSHVSLARNIATEKFLRSNAEWMLCIDADIVPSQTDIQLMLQEEPLHAPDVMTVMASVMSMRDGQPVFASSSADALVCAEYSYKTPELKPVRLGLGFTRIHRTVFEKIRELKREDGSSVTWQYTHLGHLCTDFFPSGPFISQIVPQGEWKGEDHGFFTLCMMAGITPRIETRTKLMHVGTFGYPYDPEGFVGG